MKNKTGFTLIELLAVIVVLAIIALIATPIVMNTIKNAKKGAAERTADNYTKAVEQKVAESRIDGTKIPDGIYNIQPDGNLCPVAGCGENDKDKITIDMSGNKPTSGTIKISNGGVSSADTTMTVGDYDVKYNQENNKYEAVEKEMYTNGEVVYFNVDNGTKCTSSEAVSTTGTKTGCMKFYAFNDDGGSTINLILDHNTTAKVAWVSKTDYLAAGGTESDYGSYGKNDKGPLTLLAKLKKDTDGWKGTITPSNYTMNQTGQLSNANYTIKYKDEGYKARLITAQEVATITDYSGWDEKVSANSSSYYFDSKKFSASTTCKSGDTSGCQYGWLYDRTNTSCTTYGCLNNADSSMNEKGYWTASSWASQYGSAWGVDYSGRASCNYTVSYSSDYGVRPVITVLKSNLS